MELSRPVKRGPAGGTGGWSGVECPLRLELLRPSVARNARAVCPIPYIAAAIGNPFDAQRRPPGRLHVAVLPLSRLCVLTDRPFAADAQECFEEPRARPGRVPVAEFERNSASSCLCNLLYHW